MVEPRAPKKTPPDKEPSTALGAFYRAHRSEVLAGGGVVVALFAYLKTKHPSASSTAATTGVTGSTTALDPSAQGAPSAGGYAVSPAGSTGNGATGYSSAGADYAGALSDISNQLGNLTTTLTADQTLLQGLNPGPGNQVTTSPVVVAGQPSSRPGRSLTQAEALTQANLRKDQAAAKANPSAKNKAAVRALTTRLGNERRPRKGA